MTPEQREAAAVEAMHTQAAPVDLEYTPITARLPRLVRAEDVTAMTAADARRAAELAAEQARISGGLGGNVRGPQKPR